jgi:hypothetical protein
MAEQEAEAEVALRRAGESMRKAIAEHAHEFDDLTIKELRTRGVPQNIRNNNVASIVTIVILLVL